MAISIVGTASASVYESCFRRVHWRTTAVGGDEGIGSRTAVFSVTPAASAAVPATASKPMEVIPADDDACSAMCTFLAMNSHEYELLTQ
jgi:hypothetical protein